MLCSPAHSLSILDELSVPSSGKTASATSVAADLYNSPPSECSQCVDLSLLELQKQVLDFSCSDSSVEFQQQ